MKDYVGLYRLLKGKFSTDKIVKVAAVFREQIEAGNPEILGRCEKHSSLYLYRASQRRVFVNMAREALYGFSGAGKKWLVGREDVPYKTLVDEFRDKIDMPIEDLERHMELVVYHFQNRALSYICTVAQEGSGMSYYTVPFRKIAEARDLIREEIKRYEKILKCGPPLERGVPDSFDEDSEGLTDKNFEEEPYNPFVEAEKLQREAS